MKFNKSNQLYYRGKREYSKISSTKPLNLHSDECFFLVLILQNVKESELYLNKRDEELYSILCEKVSSLCFAFERNYKRADDFRYYQRPRR